MRSMVDGPNIAQCWHQQDISGKKIRILEFFWSMKPMGETEKPMKDSEKRHSLRRSKKPEYQQANERRIWWRTHRRNEGSRGRSMREQNRNGKACWVMKTRAVPGWQCGEEIEEHARSSKTTSLLLITTFLVFFCDPQSIRLGLIAVPQKIAWLGRLRVYFLTKGFRNMSKSSTHNRSNAFTCSSEGFNHTTVEKEYDRAACVACLFC